MNISKDIVVAVIGLGYVGLPLAVEFGKKYKTIGFDISETKINNYKQHLDPTGEVGSKDLKMAMRSNGLSLISDPSNLACADFLIIAVPTPVDEAHIPDFSPLISASIAVGKYMKSGATVIFESTVYPGATEEVCIPILQRESGLEWKRDFHVGYSPERVNPGDKERTITKIVKVVSGDDELTLNAVSALYESIITAGVYRASSIKVAEAAKVIENTQRDLNIALMNELAIIFDKIGISTMDVLEAAGTKWNFLKFKPGLVGGHCVGVDPYYLTHKAEMLGYQPQVILAGRRINDGMGKFVAEKVIKLMIKSGHMVNGARIIVLGIAFKEDCQDIRNSKVMDMILELRTYGVEVFVHDPIVDCAEAKKIYGIDLTDWNDLPSANAIIGAVAHSGFRKISVETLMSKLKPEGCIADIKSFLPEAQLRSLGVSLWRL